MSYLRRGSNASRTALPNRLVASTAKKIIRLAVGRVPQKRDCECFSALQNAIVTPADLIPNAEKQKLGLLIDKYIKGR